MRGDIATVVLGKIEICLSFERKVGIVLGDFETGHSRCLEERPHSEDLSGTRILLFSQRELKNSIRSMLIVVDNCLFIFRLRLQEAI